MSLDLFRNLPKFREMPNGSAIACCPSHDDGSPSLSIKILNDGRTMLHCFGGCSAAAIVESLGLTLADLFPDRPRTQEGRAERKAFATMAGWQAALRVLRSESILVAVCAGTIARGEALNDGDHARLAQAIELIESARVTLT